MVKLNEPREEEVGIGGKIEDRKKKSNWQEGTHTQLPRHEILSTNHQQEKGRRKEKIKGKRTLFNLPLTSPTFTTK